jgi:hypothetical protein
MVVNYVSRWLWQEVAGGYLEILSRLLPEGTKDVHENLNQYDQHRSVLA